MLRAVRDRQVIRSPDEFWSRVSRNVTGLGCWMWHGVHADGDSIPHVSYEGVELPVWALAWQLLGRGVESDTVGRQTCPVPACVSPDHWELRWRYERVKARRQQPHCVHGHPLSGANLRLRGNGYRDCFACWRFDRLRQILKLRAEECRVLPDPEALRAKVEAQGMRATEIEYGAGQMQIYRRMRVWTPPQGSRFERRSPDDTC